MEQGPQGRRDWLQGSERAASDPPQTDLLGAPGIGLATSVAALAGGNVGYALLQWILLLVVARSFGSRAVGDLTLGLSVTAPVFILGSLQLRLLMITDPLAVARVPDYARLRKWSSLAAVGISAAVAALVVGEPRVLLVCVLVASCKYVELWADLAGAVYQIRGTFSRLLFSQASRGVLAVMAVSIVAALRLDLAWGLALWLAFWGTFFLLFDRRALVVSRQATEAPEGERTGAAQPLDRSRFLRATVAAGVFLGVAAVLNSVAANLPRIWLGRQGSMEVLGEFGVVSYVIGAASVILGAGVLGIAPSLSREAGDARSRRLVLLTAAAAVGIASTFSVLAFWQAERLVTALLGPAFRGSVVVLRIVVWALPFYALATVGNTVAAVERRGRQQVLAYAVTLLATGAALLFGRGARPAELAARALVLGSAVQAASVLAGLRLGRTGPA